MKDQLLEALKQKSPQVLRLEKKWYKAETVFKGEDAIHDEGEEFLPKLEGQTSEQYAKYVSRTRFFNAFKRTVQGLAGTVTRKKPDEKTDFIQDIINNIDSKGTTLDSYAKMILSDVLKIGVCATLVDYNHIFDNEDEEQLTIAQFEELNARPKFVFYNATSIPFFRYKVVKGENTLVLVILKEKYSVRIDEFTEEEYDQYRVLRINEQGFYEQQLYKEKDGSVDASNPTIVLMNDKKLNKIPLFFHGKYEEPPLYDLVTNNIKHYQLKADHNHGLHYIGLPTPYRTGVDPDDKNLPNAIGPQTIWNFENVNTKVGFLEFEGKGMEHIVTELESIKEDMAFLGASFLASDQLVNESATKAIYRNASETSSLADVVIDLSETLTNALIVLANWANNTEDSDVHYYYNDDFDVTKLTAQEILARVQAWQSGAFSKRSLYKQLKQGEVELVTEEFEDEENFIGNGE